MENHQVMQGSCAMVGGTKTDELKGVQYAVFGCGDHSGLVPINGFQDTLMSRWLKRSNKIF